jgi:hypothetical protein
MLVTELGMDTLANELEVIDQSLILVNELGLANVRLIKVVILFKVLPGMCVIPVPIVRYFGLRPVI